MLAINDTTLNFFLLKNQSRQFISHQTPHFVNLQVRPLYKTLSKVWRYQGRYLLFQNSCQTIDIIRV